MAQLSFAQPFFDQPESSPRASRLAFATMIACSSLVLGFSLVLTLERMSILRVPGPKTSFVVAAVVIADPPKLAEPPAKPEELAASGTQADAPTSAPTSTLRESAASAATDVDEVGRESAISGESGIPGGPMGIGVGCPGGVCAKGPIGIPKRLGSCVGPTCTSALAKPKPPKPIPFSALGCIHCPDPNTDALRRTAAGLRKSAGTNVTQFCVDSTGHVEPGSVETATSHGDAAIDRLCRDAVKAWRFSPTKVDGAARRACSEAAFRIQFE